jgi:hypothetical protein
MPMCDNFRFIYTSDFGGKPSPKSRFLLKSSDNRSGDRKWPAAALKRAIILIYILSFLLMLKHKFFDPFFIIDSGLFFYLYTTFIKV